LKLENCISLNIHFYVIGLKILYTKLLVIILIESFLFTKLKTMHTDLLSILFY